MPIGGQVCHLPISAGSNRSGIRKVLAHFHRAGTHTRTLRKNEHEDWACKNHGLQLIPFGTSLAYLSA